jgi:ABC-type glycerol-3-phosphate transport system permease component
MRPFRHAAKRSQPHRTTFTADGNLEKGLTMAGFVIGSIPLIVVFAFGMKYYIQGLTQGAVKG